MERSRRKTGFAAPFPPASVPPERAGAFCALRRIAGAAALLFMLLALSAALTESVRHGGAGISCLLALLLCGALLLLRRAPVGPRAILAAAMVSGVLLRLAFVLLVRTEPALDYLRFYEAAQGILRGDLSVFGDWYFTAWPGTIPICWYYAGLFSIVNSILFAQLVNLVWMTGSLYLVYRLASLLSGRKAGALAALAYAVLPSVIQSSSQLTNQHVSLFLFLLGLALLLSRRSAGGCAAGALCMACGDLLRPEAVVLYAALAALWIALALLLRRDRLFLRSALRCAAAFVCAALAASLLLGGLVRRLSGTEERAAGNGFAWKLIVGFDDAESGTYSDAHLDAFLNGEDALGIVLGELRAQKNWPDFLFRKVRAQWGAYEEPAFSFSAYGGNEPVRIGPLRTDVNGLLRRGHVLDRGAYLAALLLFLSGAARLTLSRGDRRADGLLWLLTFDAYFCAYMLIEAGARYRYFILPFLLIAGSALFAPAGKDPERYATIDP